MTKQSIITFSWGIEPEEKNIASTFTNRRLLNAYLFKAARCRQRIPIVVRNRCPQTKGRSPRPDQQVVLHCEMRQNPRLKRPFLSCGHVDCVSGLDWTECPTREPGYAAGFFNMWRSDIERSFRDCSHRIGCCTVATFGLVAGIRVVQCKIGI